METDTANISTPVKPTYLGLTKTATYGFLAALPLIILYEILIIFSNQGRAGQIRISSEVWLRQWTQYIDGPTLPILGGVLVLIGIIIVFLERHKRIKIKPLYFMGIILESSFYAVIIAILVSQVVTFIFPAMALMAPGFQIEDQDLMTKIALSIGAGIYEELLFRVILVGGLYAVLRFFLGTKVIGYVIAAVVGALLFSAIHYMGSLGDDFTLTSFTFRFLFGLALNVLFLMRGFGIAAWTHALYDIMVVTNFFG